MLKINSNQNSQRNFCVTLLKSLQLRKLTPQDVIDKWPQNSHDPLIENMYCLLFHYRDDEDVRIRDSKYADWQDTEIMKYISMLQDH